MTNCFECKYDDCIDCHERKKISERGRRHYQRHRERILAERKLEKAMKHSAADNAERNVFANPAI